MADITNIVFASASTLSFVTNAISFFFILKTYDLSQSLYHILAIDSFFTSIGSLTNIAIFTYHALHQEPAYLKCSFIMFTSIFIAVAQPFLSFLISLIRYKRIFLHAPDGWRPEPYLIKVAYKTIIGFTLYCIVSVVLNAFFDLRMFHAYNVCMEGNEAKPATNWWIFVMGPVIMVVVSTAIMDFKCYKVLKERRLVANVDISFRSSVISTILMIPYFITIALICRFFASFSSPWIKYVIIMSMATAIIILKNPLVTRLAFRVNEVNRVIDAQEDRERRRKMVIEDALSTREERKKIDLARTGEGSESDIVVG